MPRILAVVLSGLVLALATGCGGGTQAPQEVPPAPGKGAAPNKAAPVPPPPAPPKRS
ncbi:hypothetical protein [Gemmata massiliana]|uniref:hypothetical protein n=1 Tax=Gemmata massiliana TaxID=1210884 RepID=UPI0013A6AB05|nr:hypothetical protein [Gemmata massiliana]